MSKANNTGVNALKTRLGLFVVGQVAEICRLAGAMADENRAVFQRRKECAELVASLEADLSKARERLAAAETTLERSRTGGEGLVAEADTVCDMLVRTPDVILPEGSGTVDEIYSRVSGAVDWLRRQPMDVVELPPREEPAVIVEPEPEPVAVLLPPAPEPKLPKSTYVPFTPPVKPAKPAETLDAWLVRQTDALRTRQTIDHPRGWGAAQLIATWAVREITQSGRSKNHKFVPARQAAEVVAEKLRMLGYPHSEWTMTSTWAKKLDSALERAVEKGLPLAIEKFTTVSRPEHIKKYGAFTAFYWVQGKEPPAGTIPTE